MSPAAFRPGDWMVAPARHRVHRGGEERQMEARELEEIIALPMQLAAIDCREVCFMQTVSQRLSPHGRQGLKYSAAP